MENFPIRTYAINLKRRTDRRDHILEQFKNRPEFDVVVVEAFENKVPAVGLWHTITHIVAELVNSKDEYILICEDDHQFTEYYSPEKLFECIREATSLDADILLGGASSVRTTLKVSNSLFWLERFCGLQFTVIFKKFFNAILEMNFGTHDDSDNKISAHTNSKFVIYPFISTQREFGYSDVTARNSTEGHVTELFQRAARIIDHLQDISEFFRNINNLSGKSFNPDDFCHITIPTYILNNSNGSIPTTYIEQQFDGKHEFTVKALKGCKDQQEPIGQWNTICQIIQLALQDEEEVILICNEHFEFSETYSSEYLIKNIVDANYQGADILYGVIGGFEHAVFITENRYWVNNNLLTDFVVLYKKIFNAILAEPVTDNTDAGYLLSQLAPNKMLLYPFISKISESGNNYPQLTASKRLANLKTISLKYNVK